MTVEETQQQVASYYGTTLSHSDDLQTNACCTGAPPPDHLKRIFASIHPDVSSRYYGCGLVIPEALQGLRILDLGCGAGRDVYALSALVGETGEVVGIDMTPEQLAVAREHQDYHAHAFGHAHSNVTFHQSTLEALSDLELPSNYFDVIVSNCVINLCVDKTAVLAEAYRLLKTGGELYFSDVYTSRRVPNILQQDPVLYGECLSGAFYWNDFEAVAKRVGFFDPRLVEDSPITIDNPALEEKMAGIDCYSATYRLFKLDGLEHACEDYGQAVRYKGTLPNAARGMRLDKHHVIETGKVFPVCGNTYRMLSETRLAEHFEFFGDWSTHYGVFEGCGTVLPFDSVSTSDDSAACC